MGMTKTQGTTKPKNEAHIMLDAVTEFAALVWLDQTDAELVANREAEFVNYVNRHGLDINKINAMAEERKCGTCGALEPQDFGHHYAHEEN